ncbi:hypothetical protein M011DRAFT_259991 [Sporormia fimetaria CBS 119925]|uniref:Pleckstrin homology domain-containing protein n=1 Tax=Sporormia fimetaria CBS 119925 TaxID=1340428 RepID=A0A6A6UWS2_9PLEO|nr:hypothetical protein M011DRAFT_259991 [Sporormia fimetaria CBS 119925]
MALDYFSDGDALVSGPPLPSPSDTPYQSLSRRTSHYGTPSTEAPSSPAPFPPDPHGGSNGARQESIPLLDPRRFTPTLHASLVSEILSLRRDLDARDETIEELERNLNASRTDHDSLAAELSSTTKDNRAVKRQLQQLENGASSVIGEIAEERDKAKESNADLKMRLEAMQKKLRKQEEDSERVHDMWAREKEDWENGKRLLERRLHISESRLRILLNELALHDTARDPGSEGEEPPPDGMGHDSDTGSVQSSPRRRPSTRIARHSRNLSNGSYRSIGRNYRMSLLSGTGSEGHGRSNGISLADELTFDEEEEELEELELDSDDFPENEMRARRALESRQSMRQDEKAKRILGLSLENQTASENTTQTAGVEPYKRHAVEHSLDSIVTPNFQLIFPPTGPQYVDKGIQFSPPPSPVRYNFTQERHTLPHDQPTERMNLATEVEANQSRKCASVVCAFEGEPAHSVAAVESPNSPASEQQPLSPPATPKVLDPTFDTLQGSPPFAMISASTQTEAINVPTVPTPSTEQLASLAPPPPPIPIPSIAIHAPNSAPSSPKEPLLPPGTKSIATQTCGDLPFPGRSIGTQTDFIRIDKRLVKLPPHLLPSSISSRPGTPEIPADAIPGGVDRKDSHQPVRPPPNSVRDSSVPISQHRLGGLAQGPSKKQVEYRYPGNNDNGPLAYDKDSILSRPFRTSSLFAGFDGPSSDEEELDLEDSDDNIKPVPHASSMLPSRNLKSGRVFKNPPTPVPEEKVVEPARRLSSDSLDINYQPNRGSFERSGRITKPNRTSLVRQPSIRRSAITRNGIASHMRSRSPSASSGTSVLPKPPFPVPTRSSSRRIPLSKSEGSQSPTPRGGGMFSGRRPYGTRLLQHKDSLRKVRSAAVMPEVTRRRSPSPPLPQTPVLPPSPEVPPLPMDSITGHHFGHRPQLSRQTTQRSASVASSGYQASVVDAIAATMVGEWMWKYVRKRKAFGGPESPPELGRAGEESTMLSVNGVRHKRWVWISPYERSVLWSSKQPTSSSALIGKGGRKLTVQSVLDVADNTPMPRNVGTQALFNRSILILTPARALKFTTTSRERHYLWLTALSFLAHSESPIPQLNAAPPVPAQPDKIPHKPLGATLRRSHVRDSVRLAKNKAKPVAQRKFPELDPLPDLYLTPEVDSPGLDAADPPTIPRGPFHGRKRSSTGPGAPPPSVPFRSFSEQTVPSLYSSGSADMYGMQPPSVPSSVYNSTSVIASARTSEASSATRQHFLDTMGTVRMEAFIDHSLNDHLSIVPRHRPGISRGSSQWSESTNGHQRAGAVHEDFRQGSDPFRGF